MRRKILRNRARLYMSAVGINKKYILFKLHWREYAAMPIARTRRRAKAGA